MSHDPIAAQRGRELEPVLNARGWRVVAQQRENLEWWADEMWLIESEWTPRGVQAHLTFLVDPMDLNVVWALGASSSIPSSRDEADSVSSISLRHQWKNDLESFLAGLEELRTTPISVQSGV